MARSPDKPRYPRKRTAAKLREAIKRAERAAEQYASLGLTEKSAAARAEAARLREHAARKQALARIHVPARVPKRQAASRDREAQRRVDRERFGRGRFVRGTKINDNWRLCPCGVAYDMSHAARVECRCGRTLVGG